MVSIEQINDLSDQQLYQELKNLGCNIGPVIDNTRNLYRKKLASILNAKRTNDIVPGAPNRSLSKPNKTVTPKSNTRIQNITTSTSTENDRFFHSDNSTNTSFVDTENKAVQTKSTISNSYQQIKNVQTKSENFIPLEDDDVVHIRTNNSNNKKSIPCKPAVIQDLPLEFKLLDNPSPMPTRTTSPTRGYDLRNFDKHNRYNNQYSFMNTHNFDNFNPNPSNKSSIHPGYIYNESIVDYLTPTDPYTTAQTVHRRTNLLPMTANTLFNNQTSSIHDATTTKNYQTQKDRSLNRSGNLYPDLSPYSANTNPTIFKQLYNAPVPPQPAHVYKQNGTHSGVIMKYLKNILSQFWKFILIFVVLLWLFYYILLSDDTQSPIID
jgi:hypothetical protein